MKKCKHNNGRQYKEQPQTRGAKKKKNEKIQMEMKYPRKINKKGKKTMNAGGNQNKQNRKKRAK